MDPEWSEAANQMLRAGTVSDLNLLDCISQQLAEVAHLFMEEVVHEHPEIYAQRQAFENRMREDKVARYESKLKGHSRNDWKRRRGATLGFLRQTHQRDMG